jgi:hypothetical protein
MEKLAKTRKVRVILVGVAGVSLPVLKPELQAVGKEIQAKHVISSDHSASS